MSTPEQSSAPAELPAKRWKYRGLGRFVVGQQTGDTFDIYRGARTLDGARKARREVPHWHAVIYDQATDRLVAR
jgi:hypothetical protein